jgi:hypothetical protein
MSESPTAMRAAATALLSALTTEQRAAATYPVDGPDRTRWAYQPRPRPGVSLLDLDGQARKAAHRLLATAVSRVAFAQRACGARRWAGSGIALIDPQYRGRPCPPRS